MGNLTVIALFFLAQTATFEVASIKRTDPSSMMGEGSARPDIRAAGGTLTMRRATLGDCVEWAHNVQGDQVFGPAWIGTERYDISAKAADRATTAELRVMLQALLAERFKLALHHESRQLPVYVIQAQKNGPKLRATQTPGPGAMRKIGPGLRLSFEHQTVAQLADFLSTLAAVNRPVLDRTGLNAAYDFTLDLRGVLGPDTGDLVIAALAQQLGLRMESGKAPIDTVVIDHAEKTPAEN